MAPEVCAENQDSVQENSLERSEDQNGDDTLHENTQDTNGEDASNKHEFATVNISRPAFSCAKRRKEFSYETPDRLGDLFVGFIYNIYNTCKYDLLFLSLV